MSTAEKRFISPEEYLKIERASEIRHEYYSGEMFAMTGASRPHNVIAGNIFAELRAQFRDRDCETYQSDMRVKVDRKGLYTYPDVVATCDSPTFEDDELDTLINPRVIVEVLSKSTEDYDRGTKFEMYRRIPSLRDYILVAQDRVHVEHFQRQDGERWILEDFNTREGTLLLDSIACQLRVADVYTKLTFDETT
jgi:Uma2 family endonuclease